MHFGTGNFSVFVCLVPFLASSSACSLPVYLLCARIHYNTTWLLESKLFRDSTVFSTVLDMILVFCKALIVACVRTYFAPVIQRVRVI